MESKKFEVSLQDVNDKIQSTCEKLQLNSQGDDGDNDSTISSKVILTLKQAYFLLNINVL